MSQFISKTGRINLSDEKIFTFLSDFNHLKNIIPPDKVSEFSATSDTCQFKVSGLGCARLRIIEKEPFKTIKIASEKGTPVSFKFWIQLKPIDNLNTTTAIRLTFDAELNPMMKMMIGSQLQKGLDSLVDYISGYFNEHYTD